LLRAALLAGALTLTAAAPAAAAPSRYGHEGRWITDGSGRVVVMHGFNMVNKLAASGYAPEGVGFGADDARFLARNGFSVVRVGIVWKALEPQPGVYDDAYLGRVERTYRVLQRRGIAVLLDFHQDMYNERFQGEGAPDWAVLGPAATEDPAPLAGFPANYLVQDAVNHAYDAFWANTPVPATGRGVQDHYAAAWAHVAQRFAGRPGVLGYNLFNEAWPGSEIRAAFVNGCATGPRTCGIAEFEAGPLTRFHRRLRNAIRRVDRATLLWPAPLLTFDFGAESGVGRVDDAAGFAFNAYCAQAAGLDAVIPYLRGKPCSFSAGLTFKNAEAVSRRTGSALLLTEFGASDDLATYRDYLEGADAHRVSWAFWAYCGCGDPTTSQGSEHAQAVVMDPSKPPAGANVARTTLRRLARPYPTRTSGTPTRYRFTSASRTFTLRYTRARAGGGRPFRLGSITEVAIPRVQYPRGYAVRVRGARVASKPRAGTLRLALCRGARRVSVTVKRGRTGAAARRCA